MPAHSDTQLRRIFDLVVETPADQREAALFDACRGDAGLVARVRAILIASEDERFLAQPEFASPAPAAPSKPSDEPGTVIGPFTIERRLGEGGFGVVYLARQASPIRREVAIKIVKAGMDTAQVLARFAQERQALALMDHPNIARVFEAGATQSGRPFFVMELCAGESITTFCDTQRLTINQRLKLFVQVCNAIQHAHQKGLIHRDIKPSNVLVSTQDGKPHAKIIDFGIAKAMERTLTDQTLFTERHQLIGTLEYMSPEQAQGSPDIDTRADVYSLGVLLYMLLTGSTPLDSHTLRSANYPDLQRIIREIDPPRPSTRVVQSTDAIAGVAASRTIDPARLGTILRGELDWIVMKALEKDRQRRYQSASALAADLERYLAGEAVVAAPASRAYQLRKFAKRNRATVTAAVAVVVSLSVGAAAFAWQAHQARIERDRAATERDRTLMLTRFLGDTLLGVAPGVARGRDTTMLKEMMDLAADRIERGELKGSPEAEVQLRGQIGEVYRELLLVDEAERMLEPALKLARDMLPPDHPLLIQALKSMSLLRRDRQDPKGAEALASEAIAIHKRVGQGDSASMAELLNAMGLIRRDAGDLTQAEAYYRDSLAMWERLTDGDHPRVSLLKANLGTLLWTRRELDQAELFLRESVEMNQRLFGDYPVTAGTLARLAAIKQLRGDLDGSLQLSRESLAMRRRLYGNDNNREVADSLRQVATVLLAQTKYAEAEPMLQQAVKAFRMVYAKDSPVLATALTHLSTAQHFIGKYDDAEQTAAEALAMQRRLSPIDGEPAVTILMIHVNNRRARHDPHGAEPFAREAEEIASRSLPPDSQLRAESVYLLGLVLLEQSRFVDAEALLRDALEILGRLHPNGHAIRAVAHAELSFAVLRQGRVEEAETLARDGLTMLFQQVVSNHRHTGTARLRLGQVLLAQTKLDEAEAELLEAHRILTSAEGAFPVRRLEAVNALIRLYEEGDRLEPGRGHAEQADRWRQVSPVAPTTTPR